MAKSRGFASARFYNDMTSTQRKQFEKSYQSYEKAYNKLKKPFDSKLDKEEYFEEYKQVRKERLTQGLDTKAMPREIAKEQQYERSTAQDRAQYAALKESDVFKEKYGGKMTFRQFRQLDSEEVEAYLFGEIKAFTEQQRKQGESESNIQSFISAYYFGSP